MLLVTVGTYKFDAMVRSVENVCKDMAIDAFYQIGIGEMKPVNGQYVRFLPENRFNDFANSASVIVTHAGAGTVYNFLEKNYRMIVVPNLDRTDNHQRDIGEYLKSNNYAFVCFDLCELRSEFEKAFNYDLKLDKYTKTSFFRTNDLIASFDRF